MKVSFFVADKKYIEYLQMLDIEVPKIKDNILGGILGIMIDIEENKPYFIPLFAATAKLLKKKNIAKDYILVYDTYSASAKAKMSSKAIYREHKDGSIQQIYGIFNFKKMFPVDPVMSVSNIDMEKLDGKYRDLLNRELLFVKRNLKGIVDKAKAYYQFAIMSDRVYPQQIDFAKLEKALEK